MGQRMRHERVAQPVRAYLAECARMWRVIPHCRVVSGFEEALDSLVQLVRMNRFGLPREEGERGVDIAPGFGALPSYAADDLIVEKGGDEWGPRRAVIRIPREAARFQVVTERVEDHRGQGDEPFLGPLTDNPQHVDGAEVCTSIHLSDFVREGAAQF